MDENTIGDILKELPTPHSSDEYLNDPNKKDYFICFNLPCPSGINNISFFLHKSEIRVRRLGPFLMVMVKKELSPMFVAEINMGNIKDFLIGYVDSVLAEINKRMFDYRYEKCHFLAKTYSTLDILSLKIADTDSQNEKDVERPLPISEFPLSNSFNLPYTAEFVDSCYAFYQGDYNEAIKKIITCLEVYVSYHKRQGRKERFFLWFKKKNNSFISKLSNNIPISQMGDVVKKNIIHIYKFRNAITHGGKRISHKSFSFCNRCFGTLFYFFKLNSKSKEEHDFYMELETQFIMLKNRCKGRNLEDYGLNHDDAPIIENFEQLDKIFTNQMLFTEKEIASVKADLR